jgi:hypothetical protein
MAVSTTEPTNEPAGAVSDADDQEQPVTSPPSRGRYRLLAMALAAICLVLAVLEIRGPAVARSTTVLWPAPGHELLGPAPVGTPFILTER